MSDYEVKNFINMARASVKANKLMGITVDKVNEDALLDAADILAKEGSFISFGVKNTGSIKREYIQKLLKCNKYVWHTIDRMSDRGRAVDIDLINPLTGKVMTGSSSSTAVNVLYGINDIGIGTDGGGSVLAPALSLNLFSIMAKGMGLKVSSENAKKSTDGIEFTAGVGVISHSFDMASKSIIDMLHIQEEYENVYDDRNGKLKSMKIAVPEKGNITMPLGVDMLDKLGECIDLLNSLGVEVKYEKFPDFRDRKESMAAARELFEKYDALITYEGPVEVQGMGDSVFGIMGDFAGNMQSKSGKYMVKIANMLDATAVTIPSAEAASGLVIASGKGLDSGLNLLNLSRKITSLYRLPQLYYEYFKNSNMVRRNELIFSKDWGGEE